MPLRNRSEARYSSVVWSTTPRQLGPTSTAPCAATVAATLACTARPVVPVSAKPAVIATMARAPAASASSTAASKPAAGTAMTTSSTGPSSSVVRRATGRPRIVPPRRFTRCTGRRAERSASRTTA